jgi:LysM repeat protein
MKWRHWSILIILVLLNYIIFSTVFSLLADQRRPGPRPTRTLQPTFDSIEAAPAAWIVLPTHTARPTRAPNTASPTTAPTVTTEISPTVAFTATAEIPPTDVPPTPTATPVPPTATPEAEVVIHVVRAGETLSEIAAQYQVAMQSIMEANDLTNPNVIVVGQKLIIPVSGQPAPTAAHSPGPTNTPKPAPTQPPTATPTSSASSPQFTGQLLWERSVAPNCGGPAISKLSIIRDASGNPLNGVRVEVECYGNRWLSHPSGNPGEYDPGHYDFSFGQTSPQDWTCTARVYDVNGQPVDSSSVVTIHFDTNDCQPNGEGHQVAIVHWTELW